jgi:hypothetical protein
VTRFVRVGEAVGRTVHGLADVALGVLGSIVIAAMCVFIALCLAGAAITIVEAL